MDDVIYSVADRFSFQEAEILAMPLSRLEFWYRGVKKLTEQEEEKIRSLYGK